MPEATTYTTSGPTMTRRILFWLGEAFGAACVVALPFALLILAHGLSATPGADCIVHLEC